MYTLKLVRLELKTLYKKVTSLILNLQASKQQVKRPTLLLGITRDPTITEFVKKKNFLITELEKRKLLTT